MYPNAKGACNSQKTKSIPFYVRSPRDTFSLKIKGLRSRIEAMHLYRFDLSICFLPNLLSKAWELGM